MSFIAANGQGEGELDRLLRRRATGTATAIRNSRALVSPAAAAEAGQLEETGWEPAGGLPTRERELVTASFEQAGELVGASAEGW